MKTQKMKIRSLVMGVAVAILALLSFTHQLKAQDEKTSTSISIEKGVHKVSHTNSQGRFNVEYDGRIEFTDDDRAIKSISRGGYLLIRKTSFGDRREILAEPNADGTINYEYRVGRNRQEWNKEAQDFLATMLLEVIRTTGIGAEARVERFYKRGGLDGVLQEVSNIRSDYVSRIYLDALLTSQNLNNKELVGVADFISRRISSDFYTAELFKDHSNKFLKNEEATNAFLAALGRMDSDHYIAGILERVLRENLSDSSLEKVLLSVKRMDSDHYKTGVIKSLLDRKDLNDKTIDRVVLLAGDIDSDHYATQVLKEALSRPNLSDQAFNSLMDAMSNIGSDHYVTETFRSMIRSREVPDKVIEAVINRIEYMDSDHYRTVILNDLFANNKVSEKYFESLLRTVGKIDSDHYASQILARLLKDKTLNDAMYTAVLERVADIDSDHYKVDILKDVMRGSLNKKNLMGLLKVADGIDSDYYKSEVLKNACNLVRESDNEVKNQYRSVARSIRSDTYYGKVARCID
jgi:SOS response regulatory protein OraA/RecX